MIRGKEIVRKRLALIRQKERDAAAKELKESQVYLFHIKILNDMFVLIIYILFIFYC